MKAKGLGLLKNLWSKEAPANTVERPTCQCFDPVYENKRWTELFLHEEEQDTECTAWIRLNELIEQAAKDGCEEFSPGPEMSPEEWAQISVLPPSIKKLKSVKRFTLYGSSLIRIPPEIGEMTALEEFSPYTSYRLHWFPYEITRCKKLTSSTVSTRALYGNYKSRAPFPKLPQLISSLAPESCSVCNSPFMLEPKQAWVSRKVGTDVLPLLVHACSGQCLEKLPHPIKGYVEHAHEGGLELIQPVSEW